MFKKKEGQSIAVIRENMAVPCDVARGETAVAAWRILFTALCVFAMNSVKPLGTAARISGA